MPLVQGVLAFFPQHHLGLLAIVHPILLVCGPHFEQERLPPVSPNTLYIPSSWEQLGWEWGGKVKSNGQLWVLCSDILFGICYIAIHVNCTHPGSSFESVFLKHLTCDSMCSPPSNGAFSKNDRKFFLQKVIYWGLPRKSQLSPTM